MLARLLASRRVRTAPRSPAPGGGHLAAGEWWLPDLVRQLGIPEATLRGWVRRGWVSARAVTTGDGPRWAGWADADELARLSELRDSPRT